MSRSRVVLVALRRLAAASPRARARGSCSPRCKPAADRPPRRGRSDSASSETTIFSSDEVIPDDEPGHGAGCDEDDPGGEHDPRQHPQRRRRAWPPALSVTAIRAWRHRRIGRCVELRSGCFRGGGRVVVGGHRVRLFDAAGGAAAGPDCMPGRHPQGWRCRAQVPSPMRRASTTAWGRSLAWILENTFDTWLRTVLGLSTRWRAIPWLSMPSAISVRTSNSRSVSSGNARTGAARVLWASSLTAWASAWSSTTPPAAAPAAHLRPAPVRRP